MRIQNGPLVMIAASLVCTVLHGAVKIASEELETLDILVWRSIASVPLAFLLARREGTLRVEKRAAVVGRGLLGFGSMVCYFIAAKGLSLANLSLLIGLQPIFLSVLAPLILGRQERAAPLLWGLLFAGLVGSALIVGPEVSFGSLYGLWAIAAVALSAMAHTLLRFAGRHESPMAIVLWFEVITLLCAIGLHCVSDTRLSLPSIRLWPIIVLVGSAGVAAQYLMTCAYRLDCAPRVAVGSYSTPVWSLIADLVVFGIHPQLRALVGGVLIVAAGLIVTTTSRRRLRYLSLSPGSKLSRVL